MGKWIKSEKKVKRDDGKWEVVVEVCNPTAKDIANVLVTEHPWAKDGPKMGDHPDPKFIALKAGECKKVKFGPYDKEPGTAYTDVYEKEGLELKWRDGTVTELAYIPIPPAEGGRTQVAFATFLPHPWRASLAVGTPLSFFVREVTGLPDGWRVSFIRPAIGETVLLAPEVKHHPLYLELETQGAAAEGTNFETNIRVGVAGCPENDFYTVNLNASFARDTQGPSLSVEQVSPPSGAGAGVQVTVSDPVSGVSRPTIRYSLDGGRRWATELLEPIEEKFRGPFLVSGVFRGVLPDFGDRPALYAVRAEDGVGNVSESSPGPISILGRTDGGCDPEPTIPIEKAEEVFEFRAPQG